MKPLWAAENGLRLRILSVALLVLFPAAAVAYTNIENVRMDQVESAQRETITTARHVSAQLGTVVGATEQILRLLATSGPVLARNAEECDAEMQRVMESLHHYANVGAADAQGVVWCSGLPLPEGGLRVDDREYFIQAMAMNRFTHGSFQTSRATGLHTVNYAFPVRDVQGAPIGVVIAAVDLAVLQALAAAAGASSESSILFVDGRGVVLAAPAELELGPGDRVDDELLAGLIGHEGLRVHHLDGQEMMIGYRRLATEDQPATAFVLVALPMAVVNAQAASVFRGSALILGVAALVGIAAALFLAERVIVKEHRQRLRDRSTRIRALEEADRQHVLMVNEVCHDLRSPLAPIKLHLYMMQHSGETLTPKQGAAIEVVERNVEHMERLVQDLRDVFRAEAAQFAIEPRPLDLTRQLREARETFLELAKEKHQELRVHAEDGLRVKADPDRLNQAIFNLLSNAVKFSGENAQITVTAARQDGMVRVEVRDQGPGLTPEEMERLFRPFSQVRNAGARPTQKGTGLGLYISKSIIEGHGGEAGVTSDGPGTGSTFWFTLPAERPPKPVRS